MSRQINLYSSAFRRQTKKYSALWTVAAVFAVAAGMTADYAWETYQLRDLRARRGAADVQLKQLREQLLALGKRTQRMPDKALQDRVARAEDLLRGRQKLFARLESGEIGNRDGYAEFLAALARQRVDGVWLTRVEISGPGSDFTIEGRTVRADLIPGYIKLLGTEDVLRGKSIGTLAMHERQIDSVATPTTQGTPSTVAPIRAESERTAAEARPGSVRVVEFILGTAAGAAAATATGAAAGTAAATAPATVAGTVAGVAARGVSR